MATPTPTPTRPTSSPRSLSDSPVIDAEWRELTEAERAALPPPRAAGLAEPRPVVARIQTTAPVTARGARGKCPVCSRADLQLVPVRVAGVLNVKLCGRCAAVGYTASVVLGRLLG